MIARIARQRYSMKSFFAIAAVIATALNGLAQTQAGTSPGSGKPEIKPLVIALMGDPQIPMVPQTRAHVRTAMEDLRGIPCDFLAVLGDLVQNQAKYYADYRDLILKPATWPVLSLAGNGDCGAGLAAYQKATRLPLYYAIKRRGIRFLFLSTVRTSGKHKHICHLGKEQMTWLEHELAKETDATTVLFSHAPIFETTWHSGDRSGEKMPGSMYLAESEAIRKLFKKHSNIKLFAHGHLHHRYDVRDEYNRSGYCLKNGVLHVSVGATANGQGSSVLFVEPECLVVRVRDHAHKRWDDRFRHVLNVTTTLTRSDRNAR